MGRKSAKRANARTAQSVVLDEEAGALGELVCERSERIAEYKRRKPRIVQKRLAASDAEVALQGGWQERKRLPSGKVVVEKRKPHDEILENRFWSVLYQFGFEELNAGRKFQIQVTTDNTPVRKQIDVFAKVGNVVVVAECKSNAKKEARSLLKDIGEFASYQRPIANALRRHYGNDTKLKILWMFVTGNIIWSQSDKARAAAQNIDIIEERELRYFEEIAKNVGPAAKYQFLGEFLQSQRIPEFSNTSVPAIRTKLGGNWAYYFLASPDRLLPIAFVNHRGLRDVDGAPAYQRVLKRGRLKEIGAYLDGGGFFPNCILINFRETTRFEKSATVEDRNVSFGNLFLPDKYKSAWIIDGQHRLFGYTESELEGDKASIPVLAFDQISNISEAELFKTINSKQQKVAPGLLDELSGELNLTSDDFNERCSAIAARALDMMATETGNPLEDRVKTADLADSETICLTISEIKKSIISTKLLGSVTRNDVEIPGPFSRRNTKETLNALCEGLTAFFTKVRDANVDRWELGKPGHLCSNVAVQGYIRLLQALIEYMREKTGQEPGSLDAEELIDQIGDYLQPVLDFVTVTEDVEFAKRFKQPFGSGGPPRYFYQLCLLVRAKFPDFSPVGFTEAASAQASEISERADDLTKSIVDRVHRHLITVLKTAYQDAYLDDGIPQKEIKLSAMNKRIDDSNSMPVENYLDVIDFKKIIEHPKNWDLFKGTLSIQLQTEKKGQAKYVKWLERLNEVRRIPAHPFGRSYKEEDIDFLDYIDEQLAARNV
jgi:DGQHR domain-containing protein